VVSAKLADNAREVLTGILNGKNRILIYPPQFEKLQLSIRPVATISAYCSEVSKHTPLPREPDSGNKTVSATDAETTYLINLTEVAYDAVVA
jgi:hypothetical protein